MDTAVCSHVTCRLFWTVPTLSPGSLMCAFCQLLSRQCRSCVAISSYIWLLGLWQLCLLPAWQVPELRLADGTDRRLRCWDARLHPVTAASCSFCHFLVFEVFLFRVFFLHPSHASFFFRKVGFASLVSLTLPEPGIQCRFLCAWILQLHCLLGFGIAILTPPYLEKWFIHSVWLNLIVAILLIKTNIPNLQLDGGLINL